MYLEHVKKIFHPPYQTTSLILYDVCLAPYFIFLIRCFINKKTMVIPSKKQKEMQNFQIEWQL